MQQYCKLTPFVFALALAACSDKPTDGPHQPLAGAPAGGAPHSAVPVPASSASTSTDSVARQRLMLAQVPATLRPTGRLLEAWRWTDANGENVLVASRTIVAGVGEPAQSETARLLVRQYVRHGNSYQQVWQLQDALVDCFNDLTLGLLPGSTRVSDLDGDGRTETTLVYALACRGGVDPAGLKLIMHAGAAKYALRGTALQLVGNPDEVARARRQATGPTCCATSAAPDSAYWRTYGLYETEQEFAAAPPAFLQFAQQLWRRYRTRADEGTEAR